MQHFAFRWTIAILAWLPGGVSQPVWAAETEATNPFLPVGEVDRGWPFVRGPDYDGHSRETQIAERWPARGPPVLWIRELGQGYSAFVCGDGRVYTQAQSLGGQYLYCLHADTGETVWRYRYAAPYELVGVYPGPRATPTLADGRVYFAAPDGLVGCLTAERGNLVWSKNVVEEYHGQGGTGFGYSCSPAVIDGQVILPVGGEQASLVALDARDGSEVWATGSDPGSYSPAYPIEFQGRPLVIGYLENSLVVCDRATGRQLARMDLSHGYDEHSAWPIYVEPYLWFSGPFRSGSRLVKFASSANGIALERIWQDTILSNDVASSVHVDGYVFGFDIFDVQSKTHRPSRGKFRCLELLTGAVRWSQGTGRPRRSSQTHLSESPEIGQAGMVAVDGKLLLLNEMGELILLRATPAQHLELARAQVLGGELTWTTPALHRGRLYIRNPSRAVCVYVGAAELLRSSDTLQVSDVPQQEYQDLAATILAVEPEYAFDLPSEKWLWNWYLASLAILITAELLVRGGAIILRRDFLSVSCQPWIHGLAFVLAALGTTLLSQWTGDFVFTWPVCLFVVFQWTFESGCQRRLLPVGRFGALGSRLPLLLFLVVCAVYFLICRRLSLLVQWSFLAGFVGAVPTAWLRSRLPATPLTSALVRFLLSLLSFSCFYAVGVALLVVKY